MNLTKELQIEQCCDPFVSNLMTQMESFFLFLVLAFLSIQDEKGNEDET